MIELVIDSRRRDLGGFEVGRVLPYAPHRMVGPFVFFDHMGPIDFAPARRARSSPSSSAKPSSRRASSIAVARRSRSVLEARRCSPSDRSW